MNLSENLQKSIHNKNVIATQKNNKIPVDIEENLRKELESLDNVELSISDAVTVDYFIDKLDKSIMARKQTRQMIKLVKSLLHTSELIIKWMNFEGYSLDCIILARIKSLVSELAKMLCLADKHDPTQILDRFGIRFVLENDITDICHFVVKFVNIVCHLNRQDIANFMAFIQSADDIDEADVCRVKNLLNVPFSLMPVARKDDENEFDHNKYPSIVLPTEDDYKIVEHLGGNMKFYFKPKKNGYQSIHIILEVEPSSPKLPGFQIEVQFRTQKMDDFAENNINASHTLHKKQFQEYLDLFTLSEEELKDANIRFFRSYKGEHDDQDGIFYAKKFYNQRVNNF